MTFMLVELVLNALMFVGEWLGTNRSKRSMDLFSSALETRQTNLTDKKQRRKLHPFPYMYETRLQGVILLMLKTINNGDF